MSGIAFSKRANLALILLVKQLCYLTLVSLFSKRFCTSDSLSLSYFFLLFFNYSLHQGVLRNQFRLETTETGTENVCFGCFASIPKQRVLMFRMNRNKQKTNRNSFIGSIFCYFLQKILGFSVFSLSFFDFLRFFQVFFDLFRNSLFRLFYFFTKTDSFDVSIEPKQTEDPPNSLKESIFGNFSENVGLFRFVTKQFCLFRLFQYRFETPKQT